MNDVGWMRMFLFIDTKKKCDMLKEKDKYAGKKDRYAKHGAQEDMSVLRNGAERNICIYSFCHGQPP